MHPTTLTDPELRPSGLPAWDEATAAEAVDGDTRLARELVLALIAELPAQLVDLKACAARNDQGAVAEAAHHMRGATGYCGVLALDSALAGLEEAARAADAGRMAAELARVDAEAARLTANIA
jgi:HPt (histidine-containing phosphotransfer) domain-containing protein